MSAVLPLSNNEQSTPPQRWLAAALFAAAAHSLPLLLLTIPSPTKAPEELPSIAVEFSDEAEMSVSAAVANAAQPEKTQPSVTQVPVPQLPDLKPKLEEPRKIAAAPEAPKPPPSAAIATPQVKQPNLLDAPEVGVAFDESKSTKAAPDKGYASDRTSTAADRGPKNLPRGDPFMDKGQSNAIRYQEKRGEGNTPALASSAASGSVKKEGSPDAGIGSPLDERTPDRQLPGRKPLAETKPDIDAKVPPPAVRPAETAALRPQQSKPRSTKPAAQPKKTGVDAGPDATQPVGVTELPKVIAPEKRSQPVALPEKTDATAAAPKPNERTAPPQQGPVDELKEFAALLDGREGKAGRGGNEGKKSGVNARPGEKGHEGDGSLRPGHDEAVSDVTTINLESSTAEFDDARFAKKFDAKTAYVKPLARRIDAKWKAEIVARNRLRLVRGIVTMKISLRKDGKLLEASEFSRQPKGIADEYVNIAKLAIERAADPKADPFPPALSDRETIEFLFNFLY